MTYTIDSIPAEVDRALRDRAAAEHRTPEAVIVDLVASGLNTKPEQVRSNGCSDGVDAWRDDPGFQAAVREQGLIDWKTWSDGKKRRDLSGIAGLNLITAEMKEVFSEQRRVDPELWR